MYFKDWQHWLCENIFGFSLEGFVSFVLGEVAGFIFHFISECKKYLCSNLNNLPKCGFLGPILANLTIKKIRVIYLNIFLENIKNSPMVRKKQ